MTAMLVIGCTLTEGENEQRDPPWRALSVFKLSTVFALSPSHILIKINRHDGKRSEDRIHVTSGIFVPELLLGVNCAQKKKKRGHLIFSDKHSAHAGDINHTFKKRKK